MTERNAIIFRAHSGRVYHQAASIDLRFGSYAFPAVSICGKSFEKAYRWGGRGNPTCTRCRKILAERAAVARRDESAGVDMRLDWKEDRAAREQHE
jgi:hypothetical protein